MRQLSSCVMLLLCTWFFVGCGDDHSASKPASGKLIVEWAPFKLAEGVTEAALIAASNALQADFLSQQSGFVRRGLLKGKDNQWVDVIYWSSLADAEQAIKNAENSPACSKYFSLIVLANPEDPSAGVLHFEQVETYQQN